MLPSDIYAVLQWWAVLFFIGIIFLPVTMLLFSKFFDKGYIFSKVLGVSIATYTIFLLGILHITPFTQLFSWLTTIIVAGVLFFFVPHKWKIVFSLRRSLLLFITEELLFLVALFVWAYIHSFSADIHGLEKYMDYGFLNSILRTEYFPPKDMWFTPYFINYYYFGHLITGVLTKLTAIPSNITFNLMLSTIFAFCFTQTFSIGMNLYSFFRKTVRLSLSKTYIAGLLTSCLVTLAGNLHVLYAFFKAYENESPVPLWKLAFQPLQFPNSYWYPNATRFIYHTIHEFPIYSWTVADLHGHVLDIPFVLLIVGLLLSVFMQHDPEDPGEKTEYKKPKIPFIYTLSKLFSSIVIHPAILLCIGFFLAVMYMTNAWDGAIYFLLTAFVIFTLYWQKIPLYKKYYQEQSPLKIVSVSKETNQKPFAKSWFIIFAKDIMVSLITTILGFVLFTTPYNIFFKPFVSGIGVLCAPTFLVHLGKVGPLLFETDHCQHSLWWQLLILYGFFYFFVISFIIFLSKAKKLFHVDIFIMLLIILSTFLILIPEFIYVKDIYPAHYRANTMFKLVFQGFILLSISSSYVIVRILSLPGKNLIGRLVFLPLTTILVVLVMTYPYLAVTSYYDGLKQYHGLNGTSYLQTLYPTDYEAIQWINNHIKGQPVILEAQGDSYTDYARVSTNTGLPTVLGWTVHEWLWRGTYDIPAPRIADVQTMYETQDLTLTKSLLKKYNVQYVFIGALEQQKYTKLDEEKFGQIGKIVYQNGNTKIYMISSNL